MAEKFAQRPYAGEETYLFVSYAHRNREEVLPVIARMQRDGYRVWYDEGIDPGTEWDENIAVHVEKCTVFLAFLSAEYLASDNCRDELNYARDLKKARLLIYLQNVELPSGMAMRLNRLQAIHKYTYTEEEDFFEKLYSAPELDECRAASEQEDLTALARNFAERREGYEFVHLLTYDYPKRARFTAEVLTALPEGTNCICVRIEDFIYEMVESVMRGTGQEFRGKYDDADVLMLEDFEFVTGKESTQMEVYRILRDRYYAKKPVLLLNGKPLADGYSEELKALVRSAVTVRIGAGEDSVPSFGEDSALRIIGCAAEYFDVAFEEVTGTCRRREVRTARMAAMYLLRELTEMSLRSIGMRFGREGQTAAENIRKFEAEVLSNPALETARRDLMERCRKLH